MSGEVIEFSAADLEATAKAYDPKIAKAPIVIGHPKTDDPAQGWVASLVKTARGLFSVPEKVDPAFAEDARAGKWGTISAKFYRPTDINNPVPGVWYLRHVGVLGAAAPGVKGLDPPEFNEAEDGVCFQEAIAFSEWDDMTNAGLWRNLREWFLVKFGADEADRVLPPWDIRTLEKGAQDEIREAAQEQAADITKAPPEAAIPQFAEPPPKEKTVTPEEKAAIEDENRRLKAQLEAHQAAQVHAENVAFCEGQPGVLPAWRDVAVATLDHLAAQSEPVQFGEGEVKKPLIDQVKAMLAALPPAVQFGEAATAARAAGEHQTSASADDVLFAEAEPDRLALHRRIKAHAKQHNMTYAQADLAMRQA
ncbi:peptidase [Rhodoferax sp. BLA1]|uniref:peptidase n=1 Tax=Rhodoferax sp. BLA1 TaxID=2576062 RepID=UPI0015D33CFF|nr:peptidase [Rhodoferax sp. BLA1]